MRCGKELARNEKINQRPSQMIFHEEPLHLDEDAATYLEKSGKRVIYTQGYVEEDDIDEANEYDNGREDIFVKPGTNGGMELKRCSYCGAYNTAEMKSCCSCGALLQTHIKKTVNKDKSDRYQGIGRHKERSYTENSMIDNDRGKRSTGKINTGNINTGNINTGKFNTGNINTDNIITDKSNNTYKNNTNAYNIDPAKERYTSEENSYHQEFRNTILGKDIQQNYSDGTHPITSGEYTQLEVEEVNTRGKVLRYLQSLMQNQRYIVILSVVVILIVGLILGINSFTSNSGISFYDSDAMDYIWEESASSFITNEKLVARIDNNVGNVIFSLDRTKAVALTLMTSTESAGDLYLIDVEDGIQILDYNVFHAVLSLDGNGVAYYKDYNEESGTASLYYRKGKETAVIEENMPIIMADLGLTISPDGNTVGYYVNDGVKGAGYISVKGKSGELFGEYRNIIALSDQANYVYYVKKDQRGRSRLDNLYVKYHKRDSKLYGSDEYIDGIYFNQDYSEVIINHEDGTFRSVEGRDKDKLADGSLYVTLPRLAQSVSEDGYLVYGLKHFESKFYHGEEMLYYLNDDNTMKQIARNVESVKISKDLKTLIYLDNQSNLNWSKELDKSKLDFAKIHATSGLHDYLITDYGDYIYYLKDDELYQVKPGEKGKRVSSEVSAFLQLSGDTLYFLYDYENKTMVNFNEDDLTTRNSGMLCYIDKGERMTISDSDGILHMYPLGDGIIYYQNDYSIWGVSKNKKLKILLEDVNVYQ